MGDFSNKGREWQPTGKPEAVRVYDFIDKELGKVTPYGVYDQIANTGWISVGTDHDTAAFAVESIRRWWEYMGRKCYPKATELLITADGGGSNGSRNRLWKKILQQLSNSEGIQISVCHFPPGTSKWNKIEHRMFSYVSINWRGRPLINHETIVNLIANTKTRSLSDLGLNTLLSFSQGRKTITLASNSPFIGCFLSFTPVLFPFGQAYPANTWSRFKL